MVTRNQVSRKGITIGHLPRNLLTLELGGRSALNQNLRGSESIFTRRRILVITHPDSGSLLMHMMASGRYRGRGLRFSVFQGIK